MLTPFSIKMFYLKLLIDRVSLDHITYFDQDFLLGMVLSTVTLPEISHHDLEYDLFLSTSGFKPSFAAAL